MRSSIRRARATHDRVSQILAEHLLRAVYPDGEQRLVAFSDSRQDAARLNASLDVSHHLDAVRQLVVRFLGQARGPRRRAAPLPGGASRSRRAEADLEFIREMRGAPRRPRSLLARAATFATPRTTGASAAQLVERELAGVALVGAVRDYAFNELLARRPQPGRAVGERRRLGAACSTGRETPPRPRDPLERGRAADPRGDAEPGRHDALLRLADATSSRSASGCVEPRDAVAPPADLPEEIGREVVLGALRVLGLSRFYAPGGRPERDPETQPAEGAAGLAEGGRRRWGQDPASAARLGARAAAARRPGLPALGRPARPLPDRPAARGRLELRALRLAARTRQRRRLPCTAARDSTREPNGKAERSRRLLRRDGAQRRAGDAPAHRGADRADRTRRRRLAAGALPGHLPRR